MNGKPSSGNAPGRPTDPAKDASILAATRQLLFGEGVRAVSMERVARLAGVSKATLYSRHPHRDALIVAALEAQSADFREGLMAQPETLQDVSASLEQLCESLMAFITSRDHVQFMQALGATRDLSPELRQSIWRHGPERTRTDIAAWISAVHARGLLDCPDADDGAELLLGMLIGLKVVKAMYHEDITQDATARQHHVRRIAAAFLQLYRHR